MRNLFGITLRSDANNLEHIQRKFAALRFTRFFTRTPYR